MNPITYDPASDLRHWPLPMAKYGSTPDDRVLYRIIFAPSRRYLVVGEWPDGSNCAQWCKLYQRLGEMWVMEKWLPAEQFAKCRKEDWPLILGPWPDRGEYEICHAFETGTPADANLDKLIALIENRPTLSETVNWHRKDAAKQAAYTRTMADDMIRNKLPAYGGRILSSTHIKRGTKTAPLLLTAQQAGLPTTSGMRTKPNRPQHAA